MSDLKLLPCPFCGGEATLRKSEETKLYHIACFECGCRQDSSYKAESVINNWNTRTPMSNIVEKLEEAKEKAQDEMEECIFKGLPYHDSTEGKVIGITTSINIVKQEINNGN